MPSSVLDRSIQTGINLSEALGGPAERYMQQKAQQEFEKQMMEERLKKELLMYGLQNPDALQAMVSSQYQHPEAGNVFRANPVDEKTMQPKFLEYGGMQIDPKAIATGALNKEERARSFEREMREMQFRKPQFDSATGKAIIPNERGGFDYEDIQARGAGASPLAGTIDLQGKRDVTKAEKDFELNEKLRKGSEQFKSGEADKQRTFEAGEGAKTRTHQKSLAEIKQDSKKANITGTDKKILDDLGKQNANKIDIINEVDAASKVLEDPKQSEASKLKVAQGLLKTLNSKRGQDAVGVEESNRLGSLLEYNFGGIGGIKAALSGTGSYIGRDMKGFVDQIKATNKSLKDNVLSNNERVSQVETKYGIDSASTDFFKDEKSQQKAFTPGAIIRQKSTGKVFKVDANGNPQEVK